MSEPNDQRNSWQQRILTFAEHHHVEPTAVARLGPGMKAAETPGPINSWFFIRKGKQLRLRYRPADSSSANEADLHVENLLAEMQRHAALKSWISTIYEPETYAFGGPQGIATAHELFHQDSRNILDHLGRDTSDHDDKRRELSVLLCSALLRSAGLEWFERGDVWDRVVGVRPHGDGSPPKPLPSITGALKKLMTVDTSSTSTLVNGGSLEFAGEWIAAFEYAGKTLDKLSRSGVLTRGLRAVLAHHVIFHWNRIGLPSAVQGRMAATARQLIFRD
ncbi:thiopeptide-type bacteriocin biosynthesis protein [Streptomyces sp. MP131-18]|uniref:thiopeptide-type bacteriocin biosynthesis protein n=1 Tax=Streptomyces sp. MP131-18 TaxID=1857892 RepID=UPI00097C1758|nr:thiopeptide-type bacteriocin biosynthesis protein [Streptomyces sp. MP131-18]ONK13298.1 thiopeptide-type bacteriocin biosynthesis domainprotein [Streptomyces sp. MP131-18]